jgi:hypothetical protein
MPFWDTPLRSQVARVRVLITGTLIISSRIMSNFIRYDLQLNSTAT